MMVTGVNGGHGCDRDGDGDGDDDDDDDDDDADAAAAAAVDDNDQKHRSKYNVQNMLLSLEHLTSLFFLLSPHQSQPNE